MAETEILSELKALQAYFLVGYNEATGLIKKLEGVNPSVSSTGGLSHESKVKLIGRRERNIKKTSAANRG